MRVGESEAWESTREHELRTRTSWRDVFLQKRTLRRFAYLVVLMAAFNFMSHGTQDFFPTFLEDDFNASTTTVTIIALIYNAGALIGGVYFGALSQRFGRRRTIIVCALLALPVVPLFAYAPTLGLITAGAFLMQLFVQGAWGVIPAHLTELSPDEIRGFYPFLTFVGPEARGVRFGRTRREAAEREPVPRQTRTGRFDREPAREGTASLR
jgi:SHS family lactate transporter-like MFS transporter